MNSDQFIFILLVTGFLMVANAVWSEMVEWYKVCQRFKYWSNDLDEVIDRATQIKISKADCNRCDNVPEDIQ